MAAGEYVSVSSQADAEAADLEREKRELQSDPDAELKELAGIYVKRGLGPDLAMKVAEQLSSGDSLAAHARDELGISEFTTARPVQAAFTSAATFAAGAAMPLILALIVPPSWIIAVVSLGSLAFLGSLGALGARGGGAPMWKATVRVASGERWPWWLQLQSGVSSAQRFERSEAAAEISSPISATSVRAPLRASVSLYPK